MKKQIIFVADDFGMNSQINEAILHAHLSGNLHAAALMIGQSETKEAIAMARTHPQFQVGWHLHLNDSFPVTLEKWPWGASPARAGLSLSLSRKSCAIVQKEIARQWELFQETGLPCQFVNSHHHLHAHPTVYRMLVEVLGPDFTGWIRLGRVRFFQSMLPLLSTAHMIDTLFQRERKLSTWRTPDTLWGLDRLFAMKADEVRAAVSALPDGFHEFLFHPRTLSCPDTQCLLELKSLPMD